MCSNGISQLILATMQQLRTFACLKLPYHKPQSSILKPQNGIVKLQLDTMRLWNRLWRYHQLPQVIRRQAFPQKVSLPK